MVSIKFSHQYPKLWGQKKAELIAVRVLDCQAVAINKDLIMYDTYWNKLWHNNWTETEVYYAFDEGFYELPKEGKLIQLVFIGDRDIPFCTLRTYTEQKLTYYRKFLLNIFKIEVSE